MSLAKPNVCIVGSGPAGLMAATHLAQNGCTVHVYEKRKSLGRKILIAGSSGLNISYNAPTGQFHRFYSGGQGAAAHFETLFRHCPPQDWLRFVESLGIETFLGTSQRYFVKGMKGSVLLRPWVSFLKKQGVQFFVGKECVGFECTSDGVEMHFQKDSLKAEAHFFDACIFALGGASYEEKETSLRWLKIFTEKQITLKSFQASNCGFEVAWPKKFLTEAEGKPLKNIIFTNAKGTRAGELVITRYGLEGTPIYTLGQPGPAYIDLLPEMSQAQIVKKLQNLKEKLAPIRSAKKNLKLTPTAHALLFHFSTPEDLKSATALAGRIKNIPLELLAPRPIAEAISSSGGVEFANINAQLMLKKHPGVFLAGEMLDWDAPTGGFLIQACVSQGLLAAHGVLKLVTHV